MGRFVITSFRPKPGQQQALLAVLEVFEWCSEQAVAAAHQHPGVQARRAEFDSVCSYIPLSALPEAQQPFVEFRPLGD